MERWLLGGVVRQRVGIARVGFGRDCHVWLGEVVLSGKGGCQGFCLKGVLVEGRGGYSKIWLCRGVALYELLCR